jgi:hypothetical protein
MGSARESAPKRSSASRPDSVPASVIGFLFDFGDQWDFDIQTENVNVDSMIGKPQVLETHGEAPEQYRGW